MCKDQNVDTIENVWAIQAYSNCLFVTNCRYINTRPKYERRSQEFVNEIRRKIICLHEYNLQIAKVKLKYPRSQHFDAILMQYIELECGLLYDTYKEVDRKHEDDVTQKLLRLLRMILYDATQKSEGSQRDTIKACDKILLKMFVSVREEYIAENRLVANTILKLLQKLNLLDEVNELKGKNVAFQNDTFLLDPLVYTIRQNLITSDYESDLDSNDDDLEPMVIETLCSPRYSPHVHQKSKNFGVSVGNFGKNLHNSVSQNAVTIDTSTNNITRDGDSGYLATSLSEHNIAHRLNSDHNKSGNFLLRSYIKTDATKSEIKNGTDRFLTTENRTNENTFLCSTEGRHNQDSSQLSIENKRNNANEITQNHNNNNNASVTTSKEVDVIEIIEDSHKMVVCKTSRPLKFEAQPTQNICNGKVAPMDVDLSTSATNLGTKTFQVTDVIEILDDDDEDVPSHDRTAFQAANNLLRSDEIKEEENEENRSPNFPVANTDNTEPNLLTFDRNSSSSNSGEFKKMDKDSRGSANDADVATVCDSDDDESDCNKIGQAKITTTDLGDPEDNKSTEVVATTCFESHNPIEPSLSSEQEVHTEAEQPLVISTMDVISEHEISPEQTQYIVNTEETSPIQTEVHSEIGADAEEVVTTSSSVEDLIQYPSVQALSPFNESADVLEENLHEDFYVDIMSEPLNACETATSTSTAAICDVETVEQELTSNEQEVIPICEIAPDVTSTCVFEQQQVTPTTTADDGRTNNEESTPEQQVETCVLEQTFDAETCVPEQEVTQTLISERQESLPDAGPVVETFVPEQEVTQTLISERQESLPDAGPVVETFVPEQEVIQTLISDYETSQVNEQLNIPETTADVDTPDQDEVTLRIVDDDTFHSNQQKTVVEIVAPEQQEYAPVPDTCQYVQEEIITMTDEPQDCDEQTISNVIETNELPDKECLDLSVSKFLVDDLNIPVESSEVVDLVNLSSEKIDEGDAKLDSEQSRLEIVNLSKTTFDLATQEVILRDDETDIPKDLSCANKPHEEEIEIGDGVASNVQVQEVVEETAHTLENIEISEGVNLENEQPPPELQLNQQPNADTHEPLMNLTVTTDTLAHFLPRPEDKHPVVQDPLSSLYTLSSIITQAKDDECNDEKKENLEMLAVVAANQKTLEVEVASEKGGANTSNESRAPTSLIPFQSTTPRRTKTKLEIDAKKKFQREVLPRAVKQQKFPEEDGYQRITRKMSGKSKIEKILMDTQKQLFSKNEELKYKPHDFIATENSVVPPPINNVYAQKRLIETNTTSEDSNDSCELLIDLGETKEKLAEKTISIYDEDTIPDMLEFVSTEDKDEVCISIPEELCSSDNLQILSQIEDFIDNNNQKPIETKNVEICKTIPVVSDENETISLDSANIQATDNVKGGKTDHSIQSILNKVPANGETKTTFKSVQIESSPEINLDTKETITKQFVQKSLGNEIPEEVVDTKTGAAGRVTENCITYRPEVEVCEKTLKTKAAVKSYEDKLHLNPQVILQNINSLIEDKKEVGMRTRLRSKSSEQMKTQNVASNRSRSSSADCNLQSASNSKIRHSTVLNKLEVSTVLDLSMNDCIKDTCQPPQTVNSLKEAAGQMTDVHQNLGPSEIAVLEKKEEKGPAKVEMLFTENASTSFTAAESADEKSPNEETKKPSMKIEKSKGRSLENTIKKMKEKIQESEKSKDLKEDPLTVESGQESPQNLELDNVLQNKEKTYNRASAPKRTAESQRHDVKKIRCSTPAKPKGKLTKMRRNKFEKPKQDPVEINELGANFDGAKDKSTNMSQDDMNKTSIVKPEDPKEKSTGAQNKDAKKLPKEKISNVGQVDVGTTPKFEEQKENLAEHNKGDVKKIGGTTLEIEEKSTNLRKTRSSKFEEPNHNSVEAPKEDDKKFVTSVEQKEDSSEKATKGDAKKIDNSNFENLKEELTSLSNVDMKKTRSTEPEAPKDNSVEDVEKLDLSKADMKNTSDVKPEDSNENCTEEDIEQVRGVLPESPKGKLKNVSEEDAKKSEEPKQNSQNEDVKKVRGVSPDDPKEKLTNVSQDDVEKTNSSTSEEPKDNSAEVNKVGDDTLEYRKDEPPNLSKDDMKNTSSVEPEEPKENSAEVQKRDVKRLSDVGPDGQKEKSAKSSKDDVKKSRGTKPEEPKDNSLSEDARKVRAISPEGPKEKLTNLSKGDTKKAHGSKLKPEEPKENSAETNEVDVKKIAGTTLGSLKEKSTNLSRTRSSKPEELSKDDVKKSRSSKPEEPKDNSVKAQNEDARKVRAISPEGPKEKLTNPSEGDMKKTYSSKPEEPKENSAETKEVDVKKNPGSLKEKSSNLSKTRSSKSDDPKHDAVEPHREVEKIGGTTPGSLKEKSSDLSKKRSSKSEDPKHDSVEPHREDDKTFVMSEEPKKDSSAKALNDDAKKIHDIAFEKLKEKPTSLSNYDMRKTRSVKSEEPKEKSAEAQKEDVKKLRDASPEGQKEKLGNISQHDVEKTGSSKFDAPKENTAEANKVCGSTPEGPKGKSTNLGKDDMKKTRRSKFSGTQEEDLDGVSSEGLKENLSNLSKYDMKKSRSSKSDETKQKSAEAQEEVIKTEANKDVKLKGNLRKDDTKESRSSKSDESKQKSAEAQEEVIKTEPNKYVNLKGNLRKDDMKKARKSQTEELKENSVEAQKEDVKKLPGVNPEELKEKSTNLSKDDTKQTSENYVKTNKEDVKKIRGKSPESPNEKPTNLGKDDKKKTPEDSKQKSVEANKEDTKRLRSNSLEDPKEKSTKDDVNMTEFEEPKQNSVEVNKEDIKKTKRSNSEEHHQKYVESNKNGTKKRRRSSSKPRELDNKHDFSSDKENPKSVHKSSSSRSSSKSRSSDKKNKHVHSDSENDRKRRSSSKSFEDKSKSSSKEHSDKHKKSSSRSPSRSSSERKTKGSSSERSVRQSSSRAKDESSNAKKSRYRDKSPSITKPQEPKDLEKKNVEEKVKTKNRNEQVKNKHGSSSEKHKSKESDKVRPEIVKLEAENAKKESSPKLEHDSQKRRLSKSQKPPESGLQKSDENQKSSHQKEKHNDSNKKGKMEIKSAGENENKDTTNIAKKDDNSRSKDKSRRGHSKEKSRGESLERKDKIPKEKNKDMKITDGTISREETSRLPSEIEKKQVLDEKDPLVASSVLDKTETTPNLVSINFELGPPILTKEMDELNEPTTSREIPKLDVEIVGKEHSSILVTKPIESCSLEKSLEKTQSKLESDKEISHVIELPPSDTLSPEISKLDKEIVEKEIDNSQGVENAGGEKTTEEKETIGFAVIDSGFVKESDTKPGSPNKRSEPITEDTTCGPPPPKIPKLDAQNEEQENNISSIQPPISVKLSKSAELLMGPDEAISSSYNIVSSSDTTNTDPTVIECGDSPSKVKPKLIDDGFSFDRFTTGLQVSESQVKCDLVAVINPPESTQVSSDGIVTKEVPFENIPPCDGVVQPSYSGVEIDKTEITNPVKLILHNAIPLPESVYSTAVCSSPESIDVQNLTLVDSKLKNLPAQEADLSLIMSTPITATSITSTVAMSCGVSATTLPDASLGAVQGQEKTCLFSYEDAEAVNRDALNGSGIFHTLWQLDNISPTKAPLANNQSLDYISRSMNLDQAFETSDMDFEDGMQQNSKPRSLRLVSDDAEKETTDHSYTVGGPLVGGNSDENRLTLEEIGLLPKPEEIQNSLKHLNMLLDTSQSDVPKTVSVNNTMHHTSITDINNSINYAVSKVLCLRDSTENNSFSTISDTDEIMETSLHEYKDILEDLHTESSTDESNALPSVCSTYSSFMPSDNQKVVVEPVQQYPIAAVDQLKKDYMHDSPKEREKRKGLDSSRVKNSSMTRTHYTDLVEFAKKQASKNTSKVKETVNYTTRRYARTPVAPPKKKNVTQYHPPKTAPGIKKHEKSPEAVGEGRIRVKKDLTVSTESTSDFNVPFIILEDEYDHIITPDCDPTVGSEVVLPFSKLSPLKHTNDDKQNKPSDSSEFGLSEPKPSNIESSNTAKMESEHAKPNKLPDLSKSETTKPSHYDRKKNDLITETKVPLIIGVDKKRKSLDLETPQNEKQRRISSDETNSKQVLSDDESKSGNKSVKGKPGTSTSNTKPNFDEIFDKVKAAPDNQLFVNQQIKPHSRVSSTDVKTSKNVNLPSKNVPAHSLESGYSKDGRTQRLLNNNAHFKTNDDRRDHSVRANSTSPRRKQEDYSWLDKVGSRVSFGPPVVKFPPPVKKREDSSPEQ